MLHPLSREEGARIAANRFRRYADASMDYEDLLQTAYLGIARNEARLALCPPNLWLSEVTMATRWAKDQIIADVIQYGQRQCRAGRRSEVHFSTIEAKTERPFETEAEEGGDDAALSAFATQAGLTAHELHVYESLLSGQTVHQIARERRWKVQYVKVTLGRLKRKLKPIMEREYRGMTRAHAN